MNNQSSGMNFVTKHKSRKPDTMITQSGRDPFSNFGVVNPPVYHASTILHETVAALEEADRAPFNGVRYGRYGTPTTFALEDAMRDLEGGYRAVALPSGLAAINTCLMTFAKSGDHVLMVDSAYAPTRFFCDRVLKGHGVETTYYDPLIGSGIRDVIQDNTTVVFTESPGSITFEVQDIPAIAEEARKAGAKVLCDNTWATPYYFKPLDNGVDVSINAATKYIVGHADCMMGLATCTRETFADVKRMAALLGHGVGPDDCYLALRGLRTLAVRLPRHRETALSLAEWLRTRKEVRTVLHPALPGCPGHEIFKRDFRGSSGLFGVELKRKYSKDRVAKLLDGMRLLGMGYSWGGYESLIVPQYPSNIRTATSWKGRGPLLRIHAGLEDFGDIKADLEAGLNRLEQ